MRFAEVLTFVPKIGCFSNIWSRSGGEVGLAEVSRLGSIRGTTRRPLMLIIRNMRGHRGRVVWLNKLRSRRRSSMPSIERGCSRRRWPILMLTLLLLLLVLGHIDGKT